MRTNIAITRSQNQRVPFHSTPEPSQQKQQAQPRAAARLYTRERELTKRTRGKEKQRSELSYGFAFRTRKPIAEHLHTRGMVRRRRLHSIRLGHFAASHCSYLRRQKLWQNHLLPLPPQCPSQEVDTQSLSLSFCVSF